MAAKQFFVDGIGEIKVCKRHRTKRVSLRIVSNYIQVTQPTWLPYSSGLQFAVSHRVWIDKQRQMQPSFLPQPDSPVGKQHTLRYQPSPTLKSKVTIDEVIVFVPPHQHIHSPAVLELAKKSMKKALKSEAQVILLERLQAFALKYNFSYHKVRFKSMRTRWGSCNNNHDITLNVSLLLLPYELIDYVILHELVHTRHLNHSKNYWEEVATIMPDYKVRRKNLKAVGHGIMALH